MGEVFESNEKDNKNGFMISGSAFESLNSEVVFSENQKNQDMKEFFTKLMNNQSKKQNTNNVFGFPQNGNAV